MSEKTIKELEALLEDKWIEGEPYVFVSYASKDKEYVYPTVVELRNRGFNIYIDAEFKEVATRNWLDQAKEKLMSADCRGIITFLSINYMRSYACFIEQLINLSGEMEEDRGEALPVIYIALDDKMTSKQEISSYITKDDIRKESQSQSVTMETEECEILKQTFLDCSFQDFDTPEKVSVEIGKIKNKHNVVTKMNKFVLGHGNINFQTFETVNQCVDLLEKNFTNNKNKDIELEKLQELINGAQNIDLSVEKEVVVQQIEETKEESKEEKLADVIVEDVCDNSEENADIDEAFEETADTLTKKKTSVTGDITYTLYGEEYTENQSDMMLRFFAQVLKRHQEFVAELPEYKGMNCASGVDYSKPENRTEDMPSYFRVCQYFTYENGQSVCIGTAYSVNDKLKKMAMLMNIVGEDLSVFSSEQIELPKVKKAGEKGATEGGSRGALLKFTVFGQAYEANQSDMLGIIFSKIIDKHPDKLQNIAKQITCVDLVDYTDVAKDDRPCYFRSSLNVYEVDGVKYSVGGGFSMKDKIRMIGNLIALCEEDEDCVSIDGIEIESYAGKPRAQKKAKSFL